MPRGVPKNKKQKILPAPEAEPVGSTTPSPEPATADAASAEPDKKSKAKKEQKIPTRAEQLATMEANVAKLYKGRVVLRQGKDISNVFHLRRPTGITSMDLALGGGFPAGGLSQIIGKFSSGKSYLVNRTMANVQQAYGDDATIGICMTEMRFDKLFAKRHCGLRVGYSEAEIREFDRMNVMYGRPAYTDEFKDWLRDQVGSVYEVLASTAEELLETACQLVESNLYQIVLVDSFGALLTKAEAEAEDGLSQKHRGGAAMVITQFMHRLHAALNLPDTYGRPNKTTVLGINQYRDNVNAGLYGNPMKVAGGHALAHGKLVDLHLEQGKKHSIEVGSKNWVTVGKEINWEITKGKAGCHDGPKGSYDFYFGEHGYGFGVDIFTDLLATALRNELIELSGAWYSYEGQPLGQGKGQAAASLHQNPALFEKLRLEIFSKSGLSFVTKMENE